MEETTCRMICRAWGGVEDWWADRGVSWAYFLGETCGKLGEKRLTIFGGHEADGRGFGVLGDCLRGGQGGISIEKSEWINLGWDIRG